MKESFMLNINMFIFCIFISNLHCCCYCCCCCSACDASMTLKWVTDFMHRCKQKSSTHLMEAGNIEFLWKVFVHTSKVRSTLIGRQVTQRAHYLFLRYSKLTKWRSPWKTHRQLWWLFLDLIYASVIVLPGIVSMEINIKQYFPVLLYYY